MMLRSFFVCILIIAGVRGYCVGYWKNGTCISLTEGVRNIFYETVCYHNLGCFYSGPPFYHPVHSPLITLPQSPAVIMTRYMLYTQRNRYRPVHLSEGDTRKLKRSTFNPRAITRIIAHGYLDSPGVTTWMLRMKDEFLKMSDDNVIVLDWSGGNRVSYQVAVANTRVAGAMAANFIRFLCAKAYTRPEMIHFIGHSLGAQLAGYAGKRVPNLGRITGLEPAGPLFNYQPPEVALNNDDALFVDNIHTNQGEVVIDGLGTSEDAGHIDFWPWNGRFPIPGCALRIVLSAQRDPPSEVLANIIACRHLIDIELFIHSFNQSNCLFVGVECRSWEEFSAGFCDCGEDGESCRFMGLYAKPPGNRSQDWRHYLKTGLQPPYCLHQYQIIIYIHNDYAEETEKEHPKEHMTHITVAGHKSELHSGVELKINSHKSRQALSFLLTSEKALGCVHSAAIKFNNCKEYLEMTGELNHSKSTTYKVDRVKVTYLYPLPKTDTSFLLYQVPKQYKGSCEIQFQSQGYCDNYS